jgi:hypothetical protein
MEVASGVAEIVDTDRGFRGTKDITSRNLLQNPLLFRAEILVLILNGRMLDQQYVVNVHEDGGSHACLCRATAPAFAYP